jgi:type I restriction enzyme S subunit
MRMVALSDLFQIGSSKRVLKSQWKTEGVPFYRGREITRLAADGFVDNELFISEEHYGELAGQYGAPKAGDIVITAIGTIGNSHVVRESDQFYFKDASVLWMKRTADVSSEFINLWLKSPLFFDQLDKGNGATVDTLTIQKLQSVRLHLPTLIEQHRIVAILDEAFDGIATAKANAEKNLQNARALFESHLQAAFSQTGKGWDRVTLETLLERGWIEGHLDGNHGGDYPRKEEFISEGVPYISANCLDDDRIDISRAKYLSPERAAMLRKGIAKDRDVLFAHNATVGPVAILRTDAAKVILGTSLTYYRCNQKYILPEYLAHYMRSFGFRVQYEQVMKQSTRNQVPITKQREFYHLIPPIDEQEKIIEVLDGLFVKGRELESIYQQKLAALDELKKSLLHQAFSGNL